MTLARESSLGTRIARHFGVFEATVSSEFSRQFPKVSYLEEHRKKYESSVAYSRYRENRKKLKSKEKLQPLVIEKAENLIRWEYSPRQMTIPHLEA